MEELWELISIINEGQEYIADLQKEIERLNKECDTYMKIATQKENIIKEVREMINKLKNETFIEDTVNTTTGLLYAKPCCRIRLNKIKEILDKEVN